MTTHSLSLRSTLWLDAVASGVTGLLGLVLAGPLANWTELPVSLLRGAGVTLIPFVIFLVALATRDAVNRTGVKVVIGINVASVVASAVVLLTGDVSPNALGYAVVTAQGAAVALFTELQATALGRTRQVHATNPAGA